MLKKRIRKPKKVRRKPCASDCRCICHDGFGGAHPNLDCRTAVATNQDAFGPYDDSVVVLLDEKNR